jgi:hypothetical protein
MQEHVLPKKEMSRAYTEPMQDYTPHGQPSVLSKPVPIQKLEHLYGIKAKLSNVKLSQINLFAHQMNMAHNIQFLLIQNIKKLYYNKILLE